MKRISTVLCLLAITAAALAAPSADDILQAVNRPVGLVHLPRCGDGALAVALAEAQPGLYVHGQDADAAHVDRARKAADDAGLLNRRISIDRGGLQRLLPVRRSCDLVVMTDLTEKDLTPELTSEIARVLHPWYGVALLYSNVDRDTLKQWAQSAQVSDVECRVSEIERQNTSPDTRHVIQWRKAPLPGSDNWSHFWHGPDNNAVSTDTVYRPPETVQWTGKPYDATRIDLPIVADGRLFMLWNGHLLDMTFGEAVLPGEEITMKTQGWRTLLEGPFEEQRGPVLEARTAGAGVRLWHRRMSPAMWLQTARSVVVAEGGRLLVGNGGTLLELDQATGKEQRRLDMACEEIKWIAATDQYIGIVGGPDFNRFPDEQMRRAQENVAPFRSDGLLLEVLDRNSLKTRWQITRDKGPEAFDPRSPALSGGRLFICTVGGRAEAFDIENGNRQWKTETGIGRGKKVSFEWDRVSRHPVSGYALKGLYIIGAPETERCAVLSQEDGRSMWELERGRGAWAPIPLGYRDMVWFKGIGVDPVTGEQQREVDADVGGCGHLTAAPRGFIGLQGLTWDMVENRSVPLIPGKSACGSGQFAANGLIWRIANGCGHIPEWRGFNVRGPAEGHLPPPGRRLIQHAAPERLSMESQTSDPGSQTGGSWTTYRANAARTASTPAHIAEKAQLIWTAPPLPGRAGYNVPEGGILLGPEIIPVPPVIAGNTVVAGHNDGAVEALDLRTGKRRWRAQTGGRIQSSPTIWNDRVFAACADGFVYALALDDGRILWQLRVAPEAGRMMLYDQLGSRWPALGSPMVADGRVFAVAGYMHRLDGVCAVAVDAVSGNILWEQTDWKNPEGEMLNNANRLGGAGHFCWDDQTHEAVYGAGEGLPVRFSPGDGTAREAYARGRLAEFTRDEKKNYKIIGEFINTHYGAGQDIGKLAPGWMIMGGAQMLVDRPRKGAFPKVAHIFAQDENGDGRLPMLACEDCLMMPSWDEKDVLFMFEPRRKPVSIGRASQKEFQQFLKDKLSGEGKDLEWMMRHAEMNTGAFLSWQAELGHRAVPLGCALTGNAALAMAADEKTQTSKLWAFHRADGTKRWQIDLPSTPVYGGLAVAADGTVVIALRDGSLVAAGD